MLHYHYALMEKLPKSQVAKGLVFLLLFMFIPFISSSFRSFYLYLLLNILIVALGMEAGFLEAISRPHDSMKTLNIAEHTPTSELIAKEVIGIPKQTCEEEIMKVAPRPRRLKRCHSKEELSKEELFAKSEAFIGNFYMQLKMQREESRKMVHGLT
ncbi:hypothetical protein ZIOFF_072598 [Zingiber officinale]|uniref:DUF4408 domain-containing protein n=1 Tax=Zingiber officinale TaxID=94328 RepID=A0A8J5C8A4_ZINOF|nr:hypothetical protein ZIOFF_072598 [Zingiber officinale]